MKIGRVTDGQHRWLGSFEAAGIETHVWRPAQLKDGTISKRLATPIRRNGA